jgi:membrane protease YdiL (CAAX protease family)
MFCASCREEYREGFDWCRDCDVALVESLPSAPNGRRTHHGKTGEGIGLPQEALVDSEALLQDAEAPPDQGLVTVGTYFSPIEAHGCRMALEQAGLRAWVLDETAAASYGVGVGTRLQVVAEDEAAARAILAADQVRESGLSPEPVGEPEEATDGTAAKPREEGTSDQEARASEEDGRPRPFARLELLAVLLVTCVYPIVSGRLRGADEMPIRPAEFAAGAVFFAGLTFVVWVLLKRWGSPLSPVPLPTSGTEWVREIVIGVVLLLVLWTFNGRVAPLLRFAGVPDAPSPWAAFFRLPGAAWAFPVPALVMVLYEEVLFRAYLISRLPLVLGPRKVFSVIAAAALFAAVHRYAPSSTVVLVFSGLVYGLVYVASRSLPRLVVAHWLYDMAVMWSHLGGR